jgi:hypothetical protein
VPSVPEVSGSDSGERRVRQVAAAEPIQSRGEAGDRRGDDNSAWPAHPPSFGQRLHPVDPFGQMVERSEKEDRIGARIRQAERTRVTHFRAGER